MGSFFASRVAAIALFFTSLASAGTFPRIEAKFELPQITGNPFDFTTNDVRVTFASPDGKTITLPAFFDGGTTWRVRHAPTAPGQWTVKTVTLNGKDAAPKSIEPREFDVSVKPTTRPAAPGAGCYVRIDPKDKMRFAFDDGTPFFPIGYDLAWHHTGEPKMPPLVDSIAKMHDAGVTWTRIWMNVWDGKNLDWSDPPENSPKIGTLDLGVAKHWDDIVDATDKGDVHFQMVLQHHGEYSTKTNENWSINPWNSKYDGGFLSDPTKFFSDEQAKKLTRAKFRYIIARWGYSPSIMAWELFNEVEYTDAFTTNIDDVASWHAEMAKFIREQDSYHHLITTSSRTTEPKLWPAMDYYNDHVYAPDLVTAVQTLEAKHLDKPYFYGEIGSSAFGTQADPSDTIQTSLWASLMSNSAGGAMYWYWYEVEPRELLYHYTAAQNFLRASNLAERRSELKPIDVVADTGATGPLTFGPGSGWAASKATSFVVKRSGLVEGLGGMSAYLQGSGANHAMFPQADFEVDYAEAGTFAVRVDEVTPEGAKLMVSIDGKPVTSMTIAAMPPAQPGNGPDGRPRERRAPRIDTTLEVPITAGKHVVRLENTGADWIKLRGITLTPYAPQLAVVGKGSNDFATLWAYRRPGTQDRAISGTLAIPGLDAGEYRVVWWDTTKGVALREKNVSVKNEEAMEIESGAVAEDVAVFATRAGGK